MGGEHVRGAQVGLVDDGAHLVVDHAGDLIRVVALLADVAAQEDHLLALAIGTRTQLVAHAELGDHATRQVGGLLDVVRGARGGVAEHEPLGHVAGEHAGDLVLELRLGLQVAVLHGQAHGVAEGHAAADDADLGHGVALGQDALHEGMAALVVGDDGLLLVADDAALALRAGHDALQRLAELRRADGLLVAARGQDGGLVDEVGEVRAGEAGRLLGHGLEIDLLVERLALDVHLEDLEAALHVRPVEDDLAVEAVRAAAEPGRARRVGWWRPRR